ncbi:AI-2E family transporter [Candidatus Auribacterota bacterium]
MLISDKPYTFDRIVRIGITAGLLYGVVLLLGYLSEVLIPFAIAFLLTYLLNPLVSWVKKKVRSHILAVFIVLLIVLFIIIILSWIFIPLIVREIEYMGKIFYNLVNNSDFAERATKLIPTNIWQRVQEYISKLDLQNLLKTENLWKAGETVARKVLPGVWGVIAGTASFIFGLFGLSIIGLYLVFLLIDYQRVKDEGKNLIPPAYREGVIQFIQDFDSAMRRYFRAQTLVALIVGILFAIGFFLIGLPLAIVLGLFIGLLNIIPYLQIIGLIPAFSLAFIHALDQGGSLWLMFALTGGVFIVVQTIQDTLLVPKIMGKVTGLSPAIILLSLSIWGKLLGIFGLLIALPMTCLLLAYYQRFLVPAPGK